MSQTPDLQTQINALSTRLSALDGQGLMSPATGFTQQTNAAIAGLKTDLTQSVLSLEGLLQGLSTKISSLWTAVTTALGIVPQPSGTPGTTVPPAGN